MRKKWVTVLAALLVIAAAATGSWFYFRKKVIKVWVYTDYAFRFNHADWPGLVDSRFKEVNRIYERNGTGIQWKVVDSSQIDPTAELHGIDNRRATMALHFDKQTDIYVIVTGAQEGTRTGSVSPFTRVAVVVDFPNKSESVNARLMAHELAHLFGAPHDPAWLDTLMGEKPESNNLSDRTVVLIKRMRNYPFALGIDGLAQDSWEKKALAAVAEDDTGPNHNAMAHAHTVLGTALVNERKRDAAIAHFRQAVDADPQNKTSRLNLIEAYTRDGQDQPALDEAREVVKRFPDDAMAHRALGALLGREHQPEAALQELQIAARLEPKNVDTQVLIGMEQAGMFGHLDDALATLEEAVKMDPESTRAHEGLEKTQTLKQRVADTVTRARQDVHDHPNDADAIYRLAKAEARLGDLRAAIRDLEKSAQLQPNNGSYHAELAEVYLATGDTATAWAEVRKARELGTDPPPTLMVRLPPQK